jgi:Zn-dependent protease with chaperone function
MHARRKDPRHEFSEWFHSEVVAEFAQESEPWAVQRVHRVQTQLNVFRARLKPLDCTILWIPPPIAFTLHGSHIYVSRSLLERLPADDGTAFVLAHEAAHHDLGHLDLFAGWADWIPQSEATAYVAALARLFEHKTYGPQRENDADDYAVRLCHRAGYEVTRAVEALQILENLALDRGDISGVYGPENLLDPTDPERSSRSYRVQEWLWTHLHGYHPVHERLTRARVLARSFKDGSAVA